MCHHPIDAGFVQRYLAQEIHLEQLRHDMHNELQILNDVMHKKESEK